MDPIPWTLEVGTDKVTATFGVSWGGDGSLVAATAEKARDIGVLVAIPAIGPASAEIFYLAPNDADYKGDVGFNVKAVGLLNDMLSLAAGFSYNLRDSAETTIAGDYQELWQYGVGASVKYSKFKVGASINGNDLDALNQIGIDGAIALTDIFGIDAAVGLSLADSAETFQGAEFSAYAKVGMAKWSVGYQIKDTTTFNYVPAVANLNGGLFIAVDGDF
jgi:hypothetical protein